jgi:hypothetical protein
MGAIGQEWEPTCASRRVRTHEPELSSELSVPAARAPHRFCFHRRPTAIETSPGRRSSVNPPSRLPFAFRFDLKCVCESGGSQSHHSRSYASSVGSAQPVWAAVKRTLELPIAAAATSPPSIRTVGPSAERIGCSAVGSEPICADV